MSETATQAVAPAVTKPTLPPLDTVVVKRNEKELSFVNTIIKRGPVAVQGKQYLSPAVTKDNVLTDIIPWIGVEETAEILGTILKKKAKGWYDENTEDDGSGFNATGFADMASTFSARGESIPDLQDEIKEISAAQQELLNQPDFGATGVLVEYKGIKIDSKIAEVKKMSEKIIGLNTAIENKRRMTKEEKAAKEAAEKAASGATTANA